MYNGLLHLHSVLRWVILILLLVAIFQAFTKKQGLTKSSLWLMIAAHITLVLGFYQWFAGNLGLKMIQQMGMADVMKESAVRFFVIEHPTGMLAAIILITVGRGKVKKQNYSAASWLFLIALLVLMVTIPWPFREGVARPWFPGM